MGSAPPSFRTSDVPREMPPDMTDLPPFKKSGGSRRGLRARKRSLRY